MQQKLRPNPIYAILKRIQKKNVAATQELYNAIQPKTSKERKPYFLVSLSDNPMAEKLSQTECQILDHHISVYETFNDKILVFSAYHYTATIMINDQKFTLHGYFNKFGQLIDVLVKDAKEQPFNELQMWEPRFRRYCTQYTVDVLTEVFNIIESVSNGIDKDLQDISVRLDQISEALYDQNNDHNTIETNSSLYLKTIKQFIDRQTELNSVSLHPNRANIRFLQTVLKTYKAPEATVKAKIHTTTQKKSRPKTSSVEKQTSATKVKKPFIEKYSHIAPSIPKDIQDKLLQIEKIEKVTSADTILEQHSILSECSSRIQEVPDNLAIDIFIKQNILSKKVKIAITMYIAMGDTVSVNKLLPLVSTISQSMICTAAEKSPEVLSSLLKCYKGPKKISRLMTSDPAIYTDLTIEETLSTPSLQQLILFGCNPNAIDVFGRSLLYIAVTLDDIHRVRILLDAGANINQHSTKSSHRVGMIPSVICSDSKVTDRKIKSIERFASKAINREMRSFHKSIPLISSTPIMAAVQKRSLPIIRLLKERGCDFCLMSDEGMNAYSVALIRPVDNPHFSLNEEMIIFMINECGLDINSLHGINNQRKPALFYLVQYKVAVSEISKDIEVLLRLNADPNVVCACIGQDGAKAEISSFIMAIQQQYYDLAELMLNQSKIRISDDDIIKSHILVEVFKPDYMDQFKRVCDNHIRRFTPIPRIADDRNVFFNSTDTVESAHSSLEHTK